MKMDKLWIMFFVIAAGILYISANAFAQVYAEDCLDCSVCETFEELKEECIDVYNMCTNSNLPDDLCDKINEYCGGIENTITKCRNICTDDCDEQEPQNCSGGQPDGDCEAGENCPADATDCNDTICMEPTCTNGCGEVPVSSGSTDEACTATAGCTTPPCSCDGDGECTGEGETCNGGAPDGNCTDGENCPADATDCDDNICMEPTCIDGCGETPVPEGETDEACTANTGCTTPPCSCDGNGNCATVPIPGCHTHGNPDWLEFHRVPTILAKEKGCTDDCGTEYLVELRDKFHEDCGAQSWVWLKDGQDMDIDKCYPAAVFENSAPCGPVVDVPAWDISCLDCDVSEECQIRITFDKDEYCPDDSIVMKVEFIDDGNHVDFTAISAILKKPNNDEIDLFTYLEKVETGIYEVRGGIGSAGERTLEVEARFGNCEEEASESYTVHSADSPECQGGGGGTECSITITFDKEYYCDGDDIRITTEFRKDNVPTKPRSVGIAVDTPHGRVDITTGSEEVSTGKYVFDGGVEGPGDRTVIASATFHGGCHQRVTEDYIVYSTSECPDGDDPSCTDSDNGKNYFTYGECTCISQPGNNKVTYKDMCVTDHDLVEWYLDSNGICVSDMVNNQPHPCKNGCNKEKGVCNPEGGDCTDGDCDYDTQMYCHHGVWGNYYYCGMCLDHCGDGVCENCGETKESCSEDCDGSGKCSETDDGKDYYEYGVTTLSDGTKLEDYCMTGAYEKHVMEYWCTTDGHGQGNFACPDGCKDGACISGGGKWCKDTDGGENYNKYGECTDSDGASVQDQCYNGKLYEVYCTAAGCGGSINPYECPTGQKCEAGACVDDAGSGKWCTDSDGGENYGQYGECTDSDGASVQDQCYNGKLYEVYCTAAGCGGSINPYECPTGQKCENGACIASGGGTCSETDEGKDYYGYGVTTLSDGTKLKDYCMTGAYEKHVMEYWCTADGHGQGNYPCPNGCENGACKP